MEVIVVQQSRISMLINAILLIIIGVLFIYDENLALSIGFMIAGVFMIIAGIIPMIQYKTVDLIGVALIVLGIILLVIPNILADVTYIIIGIIAIILGAVIFFGGFKEGERNSKIISIIIGLFIAIAGIMILTRMDIAFILFGAFLVIAGAFSIIGALKKS
jgi:uncharacterized membrane protein HdeD (DUF308 family)